MSALAAVSDGYVVAKRNLIKIKRVPELLVFTTLQPIMFVVLFAYVFGGRDRRCTDGGTYREFLIAGIFTQTVIFGATITGAGLADDMKKGIIDRFRSLPMSRSAVLIGRTAVRRRQQRHRRRASWPSPGYVVGWRIHTGFAEALGGFLLLLVFAYAFSWVMACVGLLGPQSEVVQQRGVHRDLPADVRGQHVRARSTTLPEPLQTFAEWNPVVRRDPGRARGRSATSRRTRQRSTCWALQHPAALHVDLGDRDRWWSSSPFAIHQYRVAAAR